MHDVKRLGMRHLARLQQPFGQCIAAGKELIFIACNLLWHMYGFNVGAVRAINRDGLRIVDIVDDKWFAYLLHRHKTRYCLKIFWAKMVR